jgi:hypothetical protein
MRYYNGAPDSALQALMDRQARARARLLAAGWHPTYFPGEEAWAAMDAKFNLSEFRATLEQLAEHLLDAPR